jgi:chromosome transmission fidelity protein 8
MRTPSGTALIELQGAIHLGSQPLAKTSLDLVPANDQDDPNGSQEDIIDLSGTHVLGNMEYDGNGKNVTLTVGKHQRLRGEIVKLKNPLAILQMAGTDLPAIGPTQLSQGVADSVDIPIIEVITHKIVFNKRPEPVVYE